MKLNGTPRHYMPLPQNQSDDEENGSKEQKQDKLGYKNSSECADTLDNRIEKIKTIDEDPKYLPMSPLRMLAFILSLCMCVLFIVIFVFLLPCNSAIPDVSTFGKVTEKWAIWLPNATFTFDVTLAASTVLTTPVVLLGYTNTNSETSGAGILALQKSDGKQLWQLPLHSVPTSFLCDVIDVNGDGLPECLVIGTKGLMTAVDVKKGSSLWYLHSHNDMHAADHISAPVVLPDCDEDGLPDLAASYIFSDEENVAYICLISGGTGRIIGSLVQLPHCVAPIMTQLSWEWENKTDFVFSCSDGKTRNLWNLNSQNICDVALNRTENVEPKKIYQVPYATHDIQLQTVVSLGENKLLVTLDHSQFVLLERSDVQNFKVKWKIQLKDNQHRVVTYGHYLDGENAQLAVLVSNTEGSKVIGLNISDGQQAWSITPDNGTVTSVLSIPKYFGKTDGIIMKTLMPVSFHHKSFKNKQILEVSKSERINNFTKMDGNKGKKHMSNDSILQSFEESYMLVKCGKLPSMKKISAQEIWSMCEGTQCQPDSYTDKVTAVTSIPDDEGTVDIVLFTASVIPTKTSDSPMPVQTYVKLFNLEKLLSHPQCANHLNT